jgi:hypothetical protein
VVTTKAKKATGAKGARTRVGGTAAKKGAAKKAGRTAGKAVARKAAKRGTARATKPLDAPSRTGF